MDTQQFNAFMIAFQKWNEINGKKDDKTAYVSIKNTILKIDIISKKYTNVGFAFMSRQGISFLQI
jgi:hypothetical protein